MIYSVWNQPARHYDYYETSRMQMGANTPAPKHIGAAPLGVPIDQACWPLPPNSVKVGSGDRAKGRVASLQGAKALGGLSMDANTIGLLGFGLAAYILWRSGFLKA